MARPVIVAGNWKMHKTNTQSRQLISAIVQACAGKTAYPEIIICPPFTSLATVVELTKESIIAVGAQNMHYNEEGAFTGEIAPGMLTDLQVKYVLIGHSERRQLFGETNDLVNLKLKSALKHKLIPIVCVGETIDEREANLTDAVISRQIAAALADLSGHELKTLIVAYEPVWAIGTGKVCEATEAARVCSMIRSTIVNLPGNKDIGKNVPVLYGGSVKSSNIEQIMAQAEIDGVLAGGSSLQAEEFCSLIKAAQKRLKLPV